MLAGDVFAARCNERMGTLLASVIVLRVTPSHTTVILGFEVRLIEITCF